MRRAITMLEVLVVVTIAAVLILLALPPLASMRHRANEMTCMVRMRSSHTILAAYSNDFGDALPFGPWERSYFALEGFGDIQWGGRWQLAQGLWSLLLPDLWTGPRLSSSVRCPDMPAFEPTDDPMDYASNPLTRFVMTECTWLDGKSLVPGATDESLTTKPNSMAAVVFPSKKGYLMEYPAFCVRGPNTYFDIVIAGSTFMYSTSTSFFDGSTVRMRMSDGRHPPIGMPLLYTENGLAGRDIE